VIANLLDNAEKYGGGATCVTVDRSDGFVEIAVEDAGAGVAPDDRELVFDRFSRGAGGAGRRTGASDGVGLGLALVTEHMRLHGGSVRVEDRRDGESGARFVVSLPSGAVG
jgi:two-component system sensor histidine kinase MtrB